MADVIETTDSSRGPVVPEELGAEMDEILSREEPETSEDVSEPQVEEVSEETTDDEVVVDDTESVVVEAEAKPEPVVASKEVVAEPKSGDVASTVEEIKLDDIPELDVDLTDPSVIAVVKALKQNQAILTKTITDQRKIINADQEATRAEREKAFENRIDSHFDTLADTLPTIGTTAALTEQNAKFRREIFRHAHVTAELHGISIEDAIKDTVQMFSTRDNTAEKRLITKLNKQPKTNTPTRKKSSDGGRKYKSEMDMKKAVIKDAFVAAKIT